MTIAANGETNAEIVLNDDEERYSSSNKVRLNHKWQYNVDTDLFLRELPKVRILLL
jgi:hypothetical protein